MYSMTMLWWHISSHLLTTPLTSIFSPLVYLFPLCRYLFDSGHNLPSPPVSFMIRTKYTVGGWTGACYSWGQEMIIHLSICAFLGDGWAWYLDTRMRWTSVSVFPPWNRINKVDPGCRMFYHFRALAWKKALILHWMAVYRIDSISMNAEWLLGLKLLANVKHAEKRKGL